jgi:septum formation protein
MIALSDVELVLASTSRYRKELLSRLRGDFQCRAPGADETPLPNEPAAALAMRLASAKARAVAAHCAGAVVIGSDQVAELDSRILGKPHTAENAHAQLTACSGREVVFHTGIAVLDKRTTDGKEFIALDTTRVQFRALSEATIARYIEREKPLDCAGSFKCEGLGIALFERIESNDPTALIGLPLIALCQLLREAGIEPL